MKPSLFLRMLGHLLLAVWLLAGAGAACARGPAPAVVDWDALPAEARETIALIRAGGPFPYARKDGSAFGNRERLLPRQPRGYYREYTVPTPGAHDRGPRRIVAGRGARGDVRTADEYWYTDDHYTSFRRVVGLPPRRGPGA